MSKLPSEPKTPISSSSRRKSVFLMEWWLIKVGSKLGVGGSCNRELGSLGMRLLGSASTGKKYNLNTLENGIQYFSSPAISKRLNNNTLEAVDGPIITISDCINRPRSLSYGFSHEVCDRFLSGFPFTWEDDYSNESSNEKCGNTTETFLNLSFDDVPVTRVRDILMSATGESETRALNSLILRDIQKLCCEESLSQSESSMKSDEVSRKSTETGVDHNNKDDGVSLLNPTEKITEDSHKIHSFPVDLHEKSLNDVQIQFCKESLRQSESSMNSDEVSRKSTKIKVDHNNEDDGVSLLNPTKKIQICKESLCQSESLMGSDEVLRKSTETEVDHSNGDNGVSLLNPTETITEDSHKIHSFPVDLHEKDVDNYKETKDEHKQERMSAKKRTRASPQERYPLRSRRTKKDT